jgi:hypothetical protein
MSFVVDISSVKAVLLADRWHLVEDQSFEISEYAFGEPGGRWVPGGGGGGRRPAHRRPVDRVGRNDHRLPGHVNRGLALPRRLTPCGAALRNLALGAVPTFHPSTR